MWVMIWGGIKLLFKTFFLFVVPEVIFKILMSIGLTAVTLPAINFLLDYFKDEFYSHVFGFPADVVSILGLLRSLDALEVIFAAYFYRYAFTKLAPGRIQIIK